MQFYCAFRVRCRTAGSGMTYAKQFLDRRNGGRDRKHGYEARISCTFRETDSLKVKEKWKVGRRYEGEERRTDNMWKSADLVIRTAVGILPFMRIHLLRNAAAIISFRYGYSIINRTHSLRARCVKMASLERMNFLDQTQLWHAAILYSV